MRLLPWLQLATRRDPSIAIYLNDCTKCQAVHSKQERQAMACGYEPPVARGVAWAHTGLAKDERPTVCPGYTCKLPEVIEVSRLRAHWKVGALLAAVEKPAPQLLDAVLVLDWSNAAAEAWGMDNPVKKA